MKMKKNGAITIVGVVIILVAVLVTMNLYERSSGETLGTLDIKKLVNDYSTSKFTDVSASIDSHKLVVTNANGKTTYYDLPKDEFFVSIAPFITTTHPCAIHSLTGCQGELVGEQFNVRIVDEEGNVIKDGMVTSHSNGFIDLWLPRDRNYDMTIEYDGKTAEAQFSTFKNDNTCITTIQLT